MYSLRTLMQIYKKKSRNYSVRVFMFTIISLAFSFGLSGCYKKKDTTLRVFVLDTSGSAVAGANVEIFAEPSDTSIFNLVSLNYSAVSDKNGVALFNLNKHYESGQTGLAVVKIKATYNFKIGETVAQLVEEVDNECNVQIE